MNHRRIARTFIDWFQVEALNLAVSNPDGSASLTWTSDGMYTIGYTGPYGFRSYLGFVQDLSSTRLESRDADIVVAHARTIISDANGGKDC